MKTPRSWQRASDLQADMTAARIRLLKDYLSRDEREIRAFVATLDREATADLLHAVCIHLTQVHAATEMAQFLIGLVECGQPPNASLARQWRELPFVARVIERMDRKRKPTDQAPSAPAP